MQNKNKTSLLRKTLYAIMLLAVFLSTFDAGSISSAGAQDATVMTPDYILSDGQFVYGPNIGGFNLKNYLEDNAPHLLKYADDLYERSEYFSINPKVYITLLEVRAHLISNPDSTKVENPFDLPNMDFISQIDHISTAMVNAYYLNLYSPASSKALPPFTTSGGEIINVSADTNAGTYAIIAALAGVTSEKNIQPILDNSRTDGFYLTYIKLFENDNPLNEENHIYKPGEIGVLPAPDNLLQLPWLRGSSWFFGGVHSNGAGGVVGSPYTDASALDFSPGGIAWGGDTSNMWVVASASGVPTKISNCYFSILHSDGWETTYYHIENIQNFSGSINQNDKIGVLANTLAEATCSGGSASGPHVHFNLKRNGALTAINGTPLSGWYVHAGRWNYDTDPNYMWLEKAAVKKYANINKVLSEATLNPPVVVSSTRTGTNPTGAGNVDFTVMFSQTVTGVDSGDFSLTTSGVLGAAVSGVSGSGSIYTVTVTTGSGSGTIQLNVMDNDSILNGSSTALGGAGASNGNFTGGETYTITKTWIFGDVPNTFWANSFIERLYNDGITGGCSAIPLNYCPTDSVTRAQMAIFLVRAMHGVPFVPPTATGVFTDVPVGSFGANFIEQLAADSITSGCGGSNFCPNAFVTRAQMAVFLVRAKHGVAFAPPTATGIFTDVPVDSFGADFIEQLVADAITSGCGAGIYCPATTVKRDSMAVFLVRTFNLP